MCQLPCSQPERGETVEGVFIDREVPLPCREDKPSKARAIEAFVVSYETYRILANLVLLVHLAFVIFVVCGGWLALRWRWLPWLHIPAAVWGAAIEFGGWFCPLTPLENRLLRAAGGTGYSGGFIDRYLLPIVYPPELTRTVQLLLGTAVVAINLAAYAFFLRSHGPARGPRGR